MAQKTEKRRDLLLSILTEAYEKKRVNSYHQLPDTDTLLRLLESKGCGAVADRTLRRDFQFLKDARGIEVEYDHGERGWCLRHHPGEKVGRLRFSESDAIALLVARDALEQVKGAPFTEALERSVNQICDALEFKADKEGNPYDLTDYIAFKSTGASEECSRYFEVVADAVLNRTELRVVYHSVTSGKQAARVIQPHLLHCYRDQWRLVAWDVMKKRMSTFLLGGIRKVTRLSTRFERQEGFSAKAYFKGAFGVYAGAEDHKVAIRFTPSGAERVRNRRWHPTQRTENLPDGSLLLRMRLNSLVEVSTWILGFGPEACALEPPELVERLRDMARRTLAHYESSPAPAADLSRDRRLGA
jgi:predicted DNA-binding transcriptional regulator YafY